VVMIDWACQSGQWFNPVGTPGSCMTTPGTSFAQPITLNIYMLGLTGTVGPLIATMTETFQIPFRPSSDNVNCGPNAEEWFSPVDGMCHHGLATVITFNFASQHVTLPNQVAIGVEYNTSDYGPTPLRPQPCNSTVTGCPYDALNISVMGNALIGTDYSATGIFVNWTLPAFSCNGTGTFALDNGQCANSASNGPPTGWAGLHPQIEVDPAVAGASDTGYQIGYAANLNIGDSAINLSNDGVNGGFFNNQAGGGNLCVNVYAFDPSEEMVGCCSCLVTPNGLNALSAKNDLLTNTLTAAPQSSLIIKLVSSTPTVGPTGALTACDPTTTGGTGVPSGMLAWGSTLEPSFPSTTFKPVNVNYINATLSASELADLASVCGLVKQEGSGFGICGSCQLGALKGVKN
jgi:hypothetical protein